MEKINIFTRHMDTLIIVSSILGAVMWNNMKFNELEKDVAIIKTVLVMKNIYPQELVIKQKIEEDYGFVSFADLEFQELAANEKEIK